MVVVFILNHYSDQQMQLIKYNKIQTIKHNSWSSLHISALECHLQGVYEHQHHKSHTPLQVLMALTIIFEILK